MLSKALRTGRILIRDYDMTTIKGACFKTRQLDWANDKKADNEHNKRSPGFILCRLQYTRVQYVFHACHIAVQFLVSVGSKR